MNQEETHMEPYFDATLAIYRDFLSVYKDADTNEIKVASHVFSVKAVEGENLFDTEGHPQNFFYISVDPAHWHVSVWFYSFNKIM